MAILKRFHLPHLLVLGLAWISCMVRCGFAASYYSGDSFSIGRSRFLLNLAPLDPASTTPADPASPSPVVPASTAPANPASAAPAVNASAAVAVNASAAVAVNASAAVAVNASAALAVNASAMPADPPSTATAANPSAAPANPPSPATAANASPAPAVPASAAPADTAAGKIFDITSNGAKPDGTTDNVQAFMDTWVAACHAGGPAKVVIPDGKFLTGPFVFSGPCDGPMTVENKGTVMATTDISEYSSPEWILFQSVTDLSLIGSGTFDGQGQETWKYNDCRGNNHCVLPPTSIKLNKVTNGLVEGITSLNSKAFHIFIVLSHNIKVNNIHTTAPGDSPNTDGIHISQTDIVNITDSVIATGDDCVSIGHGSTNIHVTNVTCGPGHGISVGSLGKYDDEKEVHEIFVNNCTLKNTTNGVRIKTWAESPPGVASKITFQDIILEAVKNPIIIDQHYGSKKKKGPSKVKISDIRFKNIRGTSVSDIPVSINCSSLVPCENIELEEIDLAFVGARLKLPAFANSCANAKIKTIGKQIPPACV